MLIKDLHHVNIHVDDLAAAEEFYIDVLGLTKLARPLESPGTWLAAGSREVHLSIRPVPDDVGQHYAFGVDSVADVAETLTAHDRPVEGPFEIEGICRQIFTSHPSGNRVEFNQRL